MEIFLEFGLNVFLIDFKDGCTGCPGLGLYLCPWTDFGFGKYILFLDFGLFLISLGRRSAQSWSFYLRNQV